MSRKQLVVLSMVIGSLLVGASWMLTRDGARDAPAGDGTLLRALRGEIADLRASLDAERDDRRALEDSVAALRQEIRALDGVFDDESDAAASAGAPSARPGDVAAAAPPASPESRFDESAMVDAGFDPDLARRFRARMDEIDLDRLYLRDQATREDWLNTPRFKRENAALDAEVNGSRDEFGPDVYDWMLFASGRPNRVVVHAVLGGSAAEQAGLRTGDLIVGYGDERIFGVRELQQQTLEGDPGETTPVDVIRNDSPLRLNIPRGPLGIRLIPKSIRPEPQP